MSSVVTISARELIALLFLVSSGTLCYKIIKHSKNKKALLLVMTPLYTSSLLRPAKWSFRLIFEKQNQAELLQDVSSGRLLDDREAATRFTVYFVDVRLLDFLVRIPDWYDWWDWRDWRDWQVTIYNCMSWPFLFVRGSGSVQLWPLNSEHPRHGIRQ